MKRRRRFRPAYKSPLSLVFGLLALAAIGFYLVFGQLTFYQQVLAVIAGGGVLLLGGLGAFGFYYGWKEYQYRQAVGTKLTEVDLMTGREFEEYVAHLLKALGYKDIRITAQQGDFGVDVIFAHQGKTYAAQLKRYRKLVGIEALYQAVGGQQYYHTDHAAVITNAYLTPAAREFANQTGIFVVNRDKLGEWIEFVQEQQRTVVEK